MSWFQNEEFRHENRLICVLTDKIVRSNCYTASYTITLRGAATVSVLNRVVFWWHWRYDVSLWLQEAVLLTLFEDISRGLNFLWGGSWCCLGVNSECWLIPVSAVDFCMLKKSVFWANFLSQYVAFPAWADYCRLQSQRLSQVSEVSDWQTKKYTTWQLLLAVVDWLKYFSHNYFLSAINSEMPTQRADEVIWRFLVHLYPTPGCCRTADCTYRVVQKRGHPIYFCCNFSNEHRF